MRVPYGRFGGGLIAFAIVTAVSCSRDPNVAKRKDLASGDQYFERRQYAQAIIEYRKAVAKDPLFGEARFKLAQAYDQFGDPGNAAREYVRAADILTENGEAQLRAGLFLLAGDQFEEAKARAMSALRTNPRSVEAQLLLAQSIARMKDVDGAVAQVEDAIRMEPAEARTYVSLGAFRLAQKNADQAEAAFKRAVSLDPKSVYATRALAAFYSATGKPAAAEEWLHKAMELAPNDPNVHRALAALYLGTNRIAEAEGPLKAVVREDPSPAARLVLADYYFISNRRADAKKVLDEVKNEPAAFSAARVRLSVLSYDEGHRQDADRYIEEVLAKRAKDPEALLLKGRYLLRDGEFARARDILKTAVDSDPRRPSSHYWLGVADRSVGDNDAARQEFGEVQRLAPAEVGSRLQLAQLDLQEGQVNAAALLVNAAVTSQPANVQARLTLVDILIAQGQLPEAFKLASALVTDLPKLPQPLMQLGRIYLKQANYPAAEKTFQRAIEVSNGAIDAVGALVDAKIAAGRIPDARAVAEAQMLKNPKQPWFKIYAARAYKAGHETAKAEAALKDALALDSRNLEAYLELSRIYAEQQKLDAARTQLEAIVRAQPKAVWAHTLIAMSFHLQNRTNEARQQYEKTLEIDPRAAIAANNLAMMMVDQGEMLDRALELAQNAKREMPDSPEINDTLGLVYLKKGLGKMAVQPFELSAGQDPTNPVYRYHLGLAYVQTGATMKARAALEQALSAKKAFEGQADARRVLSGLFR